MPEYIGRMKVFHTILLVLGLANPLIGCNSNISRNAPASHSEQAAVRARENLYTDGILRKNIPLLRTVFAPTFVDTGADGKIKTRDQFLNALEKSAPEINSLVVEEARIDMYPDTAVVTERFHVAYTVAGKHRTKDGHATDVWVKLHGQWMCVAAHSSQIVHDK
jgi:hypothetical protein